MADTFDPYHKWLGIAPKDQPPNHYRLLGIELFETDVDVIQNAADQRMRHVRTFQTGPHKPESQRLLNEISNALVTLVDAAKKQAYDAALRAKSAPAVESPAPPKAPSARAPSSPAPPQPKAPSQSTGVPAIQSPSKRSPQSAALFPVLIGAGVGVLVLVMGIGIYLFGNFGKTSPVAEVPSGKGEVIEGAGAGGKNSSDGAGQVGSTPNNHSQETPSIEENPPSTPTGGESTTAPATNQSTSNEKPVSPAKTNETPPMPPRNSVSPMPPMKSAPAASNANNNETNPTNRQNNGLLPVPADAEVATARGKVLKAFAGATPEALVNEATTNGSLSAAEVYAILQIAREKAIQTPAPLAALKVIDTLDNRFQIDATALALETVQEFRGVCRSPTELGELAFIAGTSSQTAQIAGKTSAAQSLAELSVITARRCHHSVLRQATIILLNARSSKNGAP